MKKATQILGENLIRAFEESARSANDVATKSNVGQTTISAWLRKARFNDPDFNPRLDQLQAVAEELGYSIADFFTNNLGQPQRQGSASPAEDANTEQPLSDTAQRLVALVALMDQFGSNDELFAALETLLRRTLPRADEPARGNPAIRSMLDQYVADPGSLTPESITLMRKAMERAAKSDSPAQEKDDPREAQGGTGR